ncbi:MAG TPA: CSLREA domain-containing protein [Solirubrobacterales bacterium]|nr:CSLREA domain-containing protein [Solirubrobacterales bacterium]
MVGALCAALLLLAAPALASAATFEVTTTEDLKDGSCAATCSLRDAIEASDASPGPNVIKFGVAGTIMVEFEEEEEGSYFEKVQLPSITSPVEIDGASAPGYGGTPVVLLDGEELPWGEGPPTTGLVVAEGGEGTVVDGLAIGGFQYGVWLDAPDGAQICGSYVGVEPDGTDALPNRIAGIEVGEYQGEGEESFVGNEIGAGCGTRGGNLISGNGEYGVLDYADGTQIAADRIGVDANGDALPNGGEYEYYDEGPGPAGIFETDDAEGATIGGIGGSPSPANVIADNYGAGILLENARSEVKIRANSIYGNEEGGIVFTGDEQVLTATVEEAFQSGEDEMTIRGYVEDAETEPVVLDFFANEVCQGGGEGRTYLGSFAFEASEDGSYYEATIAGVPPSDEGWITATATQAGTGAFSDCAPYEVGETLTVDTLEDRTDEDGCATKCSLRDAIEEANDGPAFDTIDFSAAAEGTIRLTQGELPAITERVKIDGTSAPEYEGEPVVAIDANSSEDGLQIGGRGGVVVKGLAIGNSHYALYLGGEGHSRVCSSWFGVGLGGAPLLSGAGVFVPSGSEGNKIGVGCGAIVAPNVMSGNSAWGIEVFGSGNEIGGNEVGLSPEGSPLPNDAGGIRIAEGAGATVVGGITEDPAAPGPNEIAYNEGPGVLLAEEAAATTIRGNAIYGNERKGIEYADLDEAPPVPTIAAVHATTELLKVTGQAPQGGEEEVELDFYASAVCEPADAGVGEEFLGTASAGGEGGESYEAIVSLPSSDDRLFITVTSTGTEGGATSEFSDCFKYTPAPKPPPPEEPKQPTHTNNPPPSTEEPAPTNGETVVVAPKEGQVLIKLPGSEKYVPLEELKEIPVGAIIDATKGKVTLTSIGPNGEEQTAVFFGGVFRVSQKEGKSVVVVELIANKVCRGGMALPEEGTATASSLVATASSVFARPGGKKKGGKLWGSGHGNFTTEGNQGSATVRGTIWFVEDRCNGTTFFKTKRGIVTVKDFFKNKTLPLPAGKTYVAGEE